MTEILTVAQRAEELALGALAGLTASDWGRLGELARKHTRGELSYDAWASATLTVLDAALTGAAELGQSSVQSGPPSTAASPR